MRLDDRNQVFVVCSSILVLLFITFVYESRKVASFEKPSFPSPDDAPVGTIVAWGGDVKSVPENWKVCGGKSLNKNKYPELYEAIGTCWGGDGSPKFNLPDLRGLFLRGVDAGAKRDPDAQKRSPSKEGCKPVAVGSKQGDAIQNHSHAAGGHTHSGDHGHPWGYVSVAQGTDYSNVVCSLAPSAIYGIANLKGAVGYGTKAELTTSEETRPKNAYVYWIIKVK